MKRIERMQCFELVNNNGQEHRITVDLEALQEVAFTKSESDNACEVTLGFLGGGVRVYNFSWKPGSDASDVNAVEEFYDEITKKWILYRYTGEWPD